MRVSVVAAAVVVMMVGGAEGKPQGWETLVAALGQKIVGLWRNEKTEFMGHDCSLTVKPKIRSWELYYEGRMWCNNLPTIRGEALTRSHSGVAGKTVKDFARKALENGLIKEEDARRWGS